MNWADVKHALGIKTEEEVVEAVSKEPSIQDARAQLERVDRILEELEAIEGRKTHPVRVHT